MSSNADWMRPRFAQDVRLLVAKVATLTSVKLPCRCGKLTIGVPTLYSIRFNTLPFSLIGKFVSAHMATHRFFPCRSLRQSQRLVRDGRDISTIGAPTGTRRSTPASSWRQRKRKALFVWRRRLACVRSTLLPCNRRERSNAYRIARTVASIARNANLLATACFLLVRPCGLIRTGVRLPKPLRRLPV